MSLYVYALADAEGPEAAGLRDERVRWVRAAGLHAAVGQLEAAPEVSPESARAHDAVVRALAGTARALLPVRFGALVRDEAALAELLGPRARELAEALELVANREQMTVRILGEADAPAAAPPATTGTAYLTQRRDALHARHQAPELDAVRPALADWVAAERVDRHERGPIRATVFHLVPRGSAQAYAEALQAAATGASLSVRVSGPWPAYAFAPEALG